MIGVGRASIKATSDVGPPGWQRPESPDDTDLWEREKSRGPMRLLAGTIIGVTVFALAVVVVPLVFTDSPPVAVDTGPPTSAPPATAVASPPPPEPPTPSPTPSPVQEGQTDGPAIITREQAGEDLTLEYIFSHTDEWEESRFDVSARTDIRGLGSPVYCGSDKEYTSLELRLARGFDTLEFAVGQANDSPSSQATLVVEVTGNGTQLDLRRVTFDQIQQFELRITGINAVVLYFEIEERCEYDRDIVIAVIGGLRVQW